MCTSGVGTATSLPTYSPLDSASRSSGSKTADAAGATHRSGGTDPSGTTAAATDDRSGSTGQTFSITA